MGSRQFGGMAEGMGQGPLNLDRAWSGRVGARRYTIPQIPGVPVGQRRGGHRSRRGGGERLLLEWVGCPENALCATHSHVMSCTATAVTSSAIEYLRHSRRWVP